MFRVRRLRFDALQHIATTATHCNTLQHTAPHYKALQHTATQCNTLQQCTRHAPHCTPLNPPTLQHTTMHCNTLQHNARHCTVQRPGCISFNPQMLCREAYKGTDVVAQMLCKAQMLCREAYKGEAYKGTATRPCHSYQLVMSRM